MTPQAVAQAVSDITAALSGLSDKVAITFGDDLFVELKAIGLITSEIFGLEGTTIAASEVDAYVMNRELPPRMRGPRYNPPTGVRSTSADLTVCNR